jgi:hypothetical protein
MKKAVIIFLVLFAAAFVIGLTLQMSSRSFDENDQSLNSPMDADRPLAWSGGADSSFPLHRFSAWERLETPTAQVMDCPMGTQTAGLAYNAQVFSAMNAPRGGPHLGDDWNGIGGRNTDLGDPIYASADGVVAYAGMPNPGWGNVVIVQHRLLDGSLFQTMYAHLHEISVSYGSVVGRGQKIGTCGNANGVYDAHLHYEVRVGDGIDIGKGYGALLNRKNPTEFHQSLAAPADRPTPSVMAIHQQSQLASNPFDVLEMKGNIQHVLDILHPEKKEGK